MIIDFHTHAKPGDGDIKDFLNGMDETGIDMAVLLPLAAEAAALREANDYIHGLVKAHPDRLIGFASVVPYAPGAAELLQHYVEEYSFKGLKLHPPIQHFPANDPRITPVVAKCVELDIPILIHTGPIFMREAVTAYGDPMLVDDLAMRNPEAKIVMAHGDPLGPDPSIAAKHPHMYIDTALRYARIARLIPGVGEDLLDWMRTDEKVIFGSDAHPTRTWRFAYNLDPLRNLEVSAESKRKILGGTAAKLLKLDV